MSNPILDGYLGNLTDTEFLIVAPGTQITVPGEALLTVTDTEAVFCGNKVYVTKEQWHFIRNKLLIDTPHKAQDIVLPTESLKT